MKKILRSLSAFLVISLCFSSTGHTASRKFPVLDRVVATVNHEAIPESELNHQMDLLMLRIKQTEMSPPPMSQLKKQLLDKMILEKIQLQKATEAGIQIEEKELSQTIQQIAGRDNLSTQELQQFVEDQGVPFSQFRDSIKNEMIVSRFQQRELGQNLHISASEVEQFLNSPAGQDQTGAEYHLSHILIALPETPSATDISRAKARAEEVLRQLRKGANFSELAMSQSESPQALNGGDLGWRKTAELPSLFAKIAPTLQVGQIHGLLQNTSGFHIIKLIDKRIDGISATNKFTPSQALRNKATDILYQRKMEDRLGSWLRRTRDDAEIAIYLNES